MGALDTLLATLLRGKVDEATNGKGLVDALTTAIGSRGSKGSNKPETKAEKQAAIRNAFTLGAPSDDKGARARAMAAQAIFNDLQRNNASPAEIEAAKREYTQWANWASMSQANRNKILSNGRRQAELGNVKRDMSEAVDLSKDKDASELLRRAAVANAGGPRITAETIQDGRVTNRQVAGKYGSGSVVDTGKRGAGDAALRALTQQTLLDQAAQEGKAPSYAQQILTDYQSRINPQQQAPAQQVAVAPAPAPVMSLQPQGTTALSMLNSPTAPVATIPVDTPVAFSNQSRTSGLLGGVRPMAPMNTAIQSPTEEELNSRPFGTQLVESLSPTYGGRKSSLLNLLLNAATPTYGG